VLHIKIKIYVGVVDSFLFIFKTNQTYRKMYFCLPW